LAILQDNINKEVTYLNTWCINNKLTMNPYKSNLLIISSKSNDPLTDLTINNSTPTLNKSVRYLRIEIDAELNFQTHINVLEQKLSRATRIICKEIHTA